MGFEIIDVPTTVKEDDGVVLFESKLKFMLDRANNYLGAKGTFTEYNLVNIGYDSNLKELIAESKFLNELSNVLIDMRRAFAKLQFEKPHLMHDGNKKYTEFVNKINDLDDFKTWSSNNIQEYVNYTLDIVQRENGYLIANQHSLSIINQCFKSTLANKLSKRLA